MPYISQATKKILDPTINDLALKVSTLSGGTLESEAGTLNYTITKLILRLFPERARYWQYALVKGVLSDIQDEFYRRKTVAYENQMIAEKGDVY